LAKEDKGFRIHYVLNNPPEKWDGGVGFVTPEMITVCGFYNANILID
jgi:cytochrome-b5 reductase